MADQDTTVPTMDDKELFDSAIVDEPKQVEQPVQETPVEEERPRDELGRFAPKQDAKPEEKPVAEAAPTQQQAPVVDTTKDDTAGQVPSWRLREVNEQRTAAERRAEEASRQYQATQAEMQAMRQQLAQLQAPKQEPVDFFADPNAAIKQSLDPIEERFQALTMNLTLRASRAENIFIHGKEKFAEMEKAVQAAKDSGNPEIPMLAHRMRQSDDPVGEAMKWYEQDRLLKETGGDLTAYKNKALDEALKDPVFLAKALEAAKASAGQVQQGSSPNIRMPPSLNKAPGSGLASTALDDNDMSDAALFRQAVTAPSGRRR